MIRNRNYKQKMKSILLIYLFFSFNKKKNLPKAAVCVPGDGMREGIKV